ncbi:hypothetical protein BDP27DRAFT_1424403 [Rhodocollybia butyracea]|uniref:Uncharacterized protein n=1 Tax=Rhodocollybia butyracea TaxID=206335 RepID=A0A9P5PM99_9AGAR|nr:hypothetical protein BDP27DRAFT_1424403 [Rhodocollybia butyracea]
MSGIGSTPPQYPPTLGATMVPTPVTENVPHNWFNFPPTSTRAQLFPVAEEEHHQISHKQLFTMDLRIGTLTTLPTTVANIESSALQ